MAQDYTGMAIGVFELESECICFVALDAAAKAANVKIQAVERNRLKAGACVKMRGSVSDVKAAMEAALDAAKGHWKLDPLPIGLAFCEGEIPLGEGRFRARLEQAGERCRLHYAAPRGIILHFRDEKTAAGRGTLEFTADSCR